MVTDRVTYALENAGTIIPLDPIIPRDFFKAAGWTGTGIAPTNVTMSDSVLGGSRFRRSRRLARTITMPITIFGTDRGDIESKLRQLVNIFNDRFTTPKLLAYHPVDQDVFEMECHYSGGGDHQWGSDTDGRYYVKWPITILCPTPYWTSRTVQTSVVRASGTGRGLIRTGNGGLSRLRVSNSSAFGALVIENDGDVDAYPIWTIVGPGDSFVLQRDVDGASLAYQTALAGTDTITVDTRVATVVDQAGTNKYMNLAPAPKFFTLPPGRSAISVVLNGATSASSITLNFSKRRELLF